jgi:hypothetical protein
MVIVFLTAGDLLGRAAQNGAVDTGAGLMR